VQGDESAGASVDRNFVTALARGLQVIQAFTGQSRRMSVSQISYRTGISRAAVRRYLLTLVQTGYARSDDGKVYSLCAKTASLGNAYLSGMPLSKRGQAVLDKLSERLGEASSLAVLDGTDIVYIARASSSRIMSPALNVGGRLPAHATSIGLVLLANLGADELEQYLQAANLVEYTSYTYGTRERLLEALKQIRRDGHAVADQLMEIGLLSIAVPVRDASERVVSGINVIVPSARTSIAQLRSAFLPALAEAAKSLGKFAGNE